jgi:hypothetical protein
MLWNPRVRRAFFWVTRNLLGHARKFLGQGRLTWWIARAGGRERAGDLLHLGDFAALSGGSGGPIRTRPLTCSMCAAIEPASAARVRASGWAERSAGPESLMRLERHRMSPVRAGPPARSRGDRSAALAQAAPRPTLSPSVFAGLLCAQHRTTPPRNGMPGPAEIDQALRVGSWHERIMRVSRCAGKPCL